MDTTDWTLAAWNTIPVQTASIRPLPAPATQDTSTQTPEHARNKLHPAVKIQDVTVLLTSTLWQTASATITINAQKDSTLPYHAPMGDTSTWPLSNARQQCQMVARTQDVTKVMECSLSTTSARSTTHVTTDSTLDNSAKLEPSSTPPLVSAPPLCLMDARILDALDVEMDATC
jgi:hypothetical protein